MIVVNGKTLDDGLLRLVPYRNVCAERCQGRCCQGGSTITDVEALTIFNIHPDLKARLRNQTDEDDLIYVCQDIPGVLAYGTNTEPHPHIQAEHIIEGFDGTPGWACVFLDLDGRCNLQNYGRERGEHPWKYKPEACWLYPLSQNYAGTYYLDDRAPHTCFTDGPMVPLFTLLREELTYLLGEVGYAELEKIYEAGV